MGGMVSFSTLCTINKACYLRSIQKWYTYYLTQDWTWGTLSNIKFDTPEEELAWYKRTQTYEALKNNFIVNGDDILFKADDLLYEIWKNETSKAGLKMSQGKNYKSTDMCMINSQLFKKNKSGEIIRVGYLNQGMVYGTTQDLSNPLQYTQGLNDMFKLCPQAKFVLPIVFNRFNNRYGNFRPNWFMPMELGGFGILPEYSSDEIHITKEQKRMAYLFKSNPALALHRKMRAIEDGPKMSPILSKIFDKISKIKMVQGPFVPLPSQISHKESEWIARFSLMNYLSNPIKFVTDANDYRNRKFKKTYGKKLDRSKCLNFDNQFFLMNLPCPGLLPIRSDLSFERQDDEQRGYSL